MTDIVERLRNRNGRPDGFGIGPVCDAAADEIESLRPDAARYRWLQKQIYIDPKLLILRINGVFLRNDVSLPVAFDAAIDAAMKAP
jgi:hypothetical protein